MREENNRPAGGTDEAATEDIIVEKQIKTKDAVHTGAQGETRHIPTDAQDADRELDVNVGSSRFIKTGTTPFHSVRAEQSEQETVTEISTFADRLTTKASASKIHTGYTGKLNTYDAVHAAGNGEKMIRAKSEEELAAEAEEEQEQLPGQQTLDLDAPVPVPDKEITEKTADEEETAEAAEEETKEFGFDSAAAKTKVISDHAETADAAPEAEAEAAPADDKTRVIGGGAKPAPGRRRGRKRPPNTKSDLLREIADSAEEDVRRNPDQLMMDGFSDPEKEAEENERRKKEAEELEMELSKSRAKLVSNFKFRGHPETREPADEKFSGGGNAEKTLPGPLQKFADKFAHIPNIFTPVNSREYTDYNERKAVFTALMDARRNTLARIGLVGLLGLVIFLIDAIAHGSAVKHNGIFTVLGGNPNVLLILNLVFLALTAGMLFPELKNGVISALKIRPKTDTALLLMFGGALIQNVAAFFSPLQLENDYRLMTPAVILLCLPYLAAKLFYYDNTRHCFKSVAAKSDKTYLRKITDKQLTARLLRDNDTAETNVVYAGKTRFISGFLSRSARSPYDGMPTARTIFFSAAVSVIAALLAWILKGSFMHAATALPMALAISFPVCSLAASGWMIAEENKRLSLKSSFILRYADAHDFSAVDNIAVDADELFSGTVADCLTANGVKEKQARFVAAAVAKQAGGIVASTFAPDIAQFADKLPPSESTVYEDRMGLSAWVNGCKVLLGSRALLNNHNVTVPAEDRINSILGQDEQPLFLAMEGHFTAVFAVRYDLRANLSAGLPELVERGTNLLITTNDANVTEAFAERLLGFTTDCVRMIGSAAAQQFSEAKSARSDTEEAGVVFGDSFQSLCRCAAAAIRLERTQKLAQLLCSIGVWAMLAIALIFVVTGAFTRLSSVVPVLLQILWIGSCFAAPFLSNRLGMNKKQPTPPSRGRRAAAEGEAPDEWDETPFEDFDLPEPAPAGSPEPEQPKPRREIPKNTVFEIEVKTRPGSSGSAAPAAKEPAPEDSNPEDVSATLSQFEPREPAAPIFAQDADDYEEDDDFEEIPDADSGAGSLFSGLLAKLPAIPKKEKKRNAPKERRADGFFSRLMAPPEDDDDDDDWDGLSDEDDAPAVPAFTKRPQRSPAPERKPAASRKRPEETDETPPKKADTGYDTAGYSLPPLPDQSFSLFTKGEERYNVDKSARQIEDDYEEHRAMERQVRQTFTAPEAPAAPYYELGKKEEPEPVISGEFVPPREKVNIYDDGLFSRFEDDKIFAGLYDDNGNRRRD